MNAILRLSTAEEGPLRLSDLGANRSYWSDQGDDMCSIVALEGQAICIKKVGHQIFVYRENSTQAPGGQTHGKVTQEQRS